MQPGVYETTLLVNSNDPLKPFVEVPVSMTVATVAPFSVEIEGLLDGLVGESYAFTATVSPISTTLPIEYSWQASGQGAVIHTNGLSDTLAYTWDSPGTQLITVTATNFGGSVVATHTLTINDVPISGLLASSDSPTLLGESTTFTATVEAGTNLSYAWDFGDDFSASGVVVTHTYAAAGVYTATVTASNSVGSEQASTLVQVVIPETKVYLPVIPQGDTPGVEEVFWRRQE
jgi:PKD repeat protein